MTISKSDIEQAHDLIRPFIHKTQIMTCKTINEVTGAEVYFKCENFQKIGAFKIRGGMHASLKLSKEDLHKGIATHSSGNHAQAIAFAARALGTKAYIVMPASSPAVKVDAVKGYGGIVTICEPNQKAREETLQQIVDETGATFIHPYNNYEVITGQATCAKELYEEINDLDYILAPVGGGGLLSGTLLATQYFSPSTVVYAGEPEGAADAVLSIHSGMIESAPYVKTIADGLLTTLGDKTLPIIQKYVKDILLVSDNDIKAALKMVYQRMKIVVEPSAIVPFAAVLNNKSLFQGKKIGIILSGGNVDVTKLSEWLI